MLLATVPAAPPTRKNQRTTSCPAPISAKVPYQRGSRLIRSAFEWVSIVSSFMSTSGSLGLQLVHQSPEGKAAGEPDAETFESGKQERIAADTAASTARN